MRSGTEPAPGMLGAAGWAPPRAGGAGVPATPPPCWGLHAQAAHACVRGCERWERSPSPL